LPPNTIKEGRRGRPSSLNIFEVNIVVEQYQA